MRVLIVFISLFLIFNSDAASQQQCTTNNVRLSKLRTSMLKLMELTDKYICKSSRSDSATTARTDVTDQAAPITDDLCRKDFEPKSGNKKLVLCSIAAQQYKQEFDLSKIDTRLCTHLLLADYFNVTIKKGFEFSLVENLTHDIATFIKEFKSKGDRKVFVIIGGYKYMLYEHFSDMAASDENRALFVKSVVKVMDLYELDGAAPFWVYPGCPNSNCFTAKRKSDAKNFVKLMSELSAELRPKGKQLLAKGSNFASLLSQMFLFKELEEFVDYWLANCMYYEGHWSSSAKPAFPYTKTKDCLIGYLGYFPKEKIIMGTSSHAHSLVLTNAKLTNVGATIKSFEGRQDFKSFRNVCKVVNIEGGSVVYTNDSGRVHSYAFKDKDWVSFENTQSLREKMEFIVSKDVAGVYFEHLACDDFDGKACNCGKYPLLRTINEELRGEKKCNFPACPQPTP